MNPKAAAKPVGSLILFADAYPDGNGGFLIKLCPPRGFLNQRCRAYANPLSVMTANHHANPTPKVRVLIADDHDIVRVGLRALLDVHPQLEVVGEARNGTETLTLTEQHQPDVLLIDMRMPEIDGIEICRRLKARPPSPAVLFLTSYADEPTTHAAMEAGADGYLLKSFSGQDIPQAVLTVAEGGFVMDPTLTERASQTEPNGNSTPDKKTAGQKKTPTEPITLQEQRVLGLVVQGLSNRQVAHQLGLSEGTVRNYLSNAFGKLGVHTRVQAILWWNQNQGVR